MSDRTTQERFVREISTHLLGKQAVFKPFLYRNGEEPADLAWVIGRYVAIINVTSGGRPLQAKRKHNNAQLHRWLRRWKQGATLCGPNGSLGYSDVEFVIGISVIGGLGTASFIDDDQILFDASKCDSKLCACASITEEVFLRLSRRSVGIKDIMYFLQYLRARGDIVNNDDAIAWIDHWEQHQATQARKVFEEILPDGASLNESWNEALHIMRSIRRSDENSDALLDLTMGDLVWLSVAERSLVSRIAKPGENGTVLSRTERDGVGYSVNVIVAAHMGKLKNFDYSVLPGMGITLITTLDLGHELPCRTLLNHGNGNSAYNMLREFREGAILSK